MPAQSQITAIGLATRLAVGALAKAGARSDTLLHQAGITRFDAANPKLRVRVANQVRFLSLAAEALDDDLLGLRLAQGMELGQQGLLYYVASAAPTLGEALDHVIRYIGVANRGVRISAVRSAEAVSVGFDFAGYDRAEDRHFAEFSMAAFVRSNRGIGDGTQGPLRVRFRHARNSGVADVRRFFACPVEFGAANDGFDLAPAALAAPARAADRHLHDMLTAYCDEALRARPALSHGLRGLVESELALLLPHGGYESERVARHFAMSRRTFARRLHEEGTSFGDILDDLRRDLALRYVTDKGLSLAEIAWLLGYSEATSFNHAFRRWTGMTPSQARARASAA